MKRSIWAQAAEELEAEIGAAVRAIEGNAAKDFLASVAVQRRLAESLAGATGALTAGSVEPGADIGAISAACLKLKLAISLYEAVIEQARRNGCLLATVSGGETGGRGATWSLHV